LPLLQLWPIGLTIPLIIYRPIKLNHKNNCPLKNMPVTSPSSRQSPPVQPPRTTRCIFCSS
jgi:hypothetical protein